MNGFTQFLLKAGPTRLFAALGVTAVVAALLFALIFRIGGEEKALLFSGIDMREAGEIAQSWIKPTSPTNCAATAPRSSWRARACWTRG